MIKRKIACLIFLKKEGYRAKLIIKEEILLVSASLAYEVAKSDGEIGHTELDKINNQLENIKKHIDKETSELLSIIENKSNQSVSFHDLVNLVNKKFTLEQKHMLIRFYGMLPIRIIFLRLMRRG